VSNEGFEMSFQTRLEEYLDRLEVPAEAVTLGSDRRAYRDATLDDRRELAKLLRSAIRSSDSVMFIAVIAFVAQLVGVFYVALARNDAVLVSTVVEGTLAGGFGVWIGRIWLWRNYLLFCAALVPRMSDDRIGALAETMTLSNPWTSGFRAFPKGTEGLDRSGTQIPSDTDAQETSSPAD
jgi:hypothetical protein